MLDTSHANLRAEIEAAKTLRAARLSAWDRMIAEYHGPFFDGGSGEFVTYNTAADIVSNLNPQMVFSNPRVRFGSSRPAHQRALIRGLEAAVNQWIEETNPRENYEEVCVDWDFAYGILHTAPTAVRGLSRDHEDPLHRPQDTRISPAEFVADARGKSFRGARWLGHPVSIDQDDLIKQAERENKEAREAEPPEKPPWNISAIKAMKEGEGEQELALDQHAKNVPHRKTVTYYPIWVPEAEIPEDYSPALYHGMIFYVTLSDVARDQSGRTSKKNEGFIRAPEPFFGPRWGPYTFFKAYYVPDKQHALAVMPANYGNHETLNRHADANAAANERRKKIAAVDDMDSDLQQKVEDCPDGGVVAMKSTSIRDGIKEFELGGATDQGLRAEAFALERRNQGLGLSDAGRGSPDPDISATADVIADRSMNRRVSHLANKFRIDGVAMHLKTVAWYIFADDRVVTFLGSRSDKLGMDEAVWVGGYGKGQRDRIRKEFPSMSMPSEDEIGEEALEQEEEGYERYLSEFDLLQLTVEPYSMMRADDPALQQRAMQMLGLVQQLAQIVPQTAGWTDWRPILENIEDSFNWPGFADIFKWPVVEQLGEAMLQQFGAQPAPPQPKGAGTKRMAGDVGAPSVGLKPVRSEPAARPFTYAANGR